MAIRYIPPKRFIDTFERVTNEVMDLLGRGGTAIVEPETVRLADLDKDYAISQILAQVVGAHSNLTFAGAVTIPASSSMVLAGSVSFPTISSIDTVVWVEQKHPSIVLNPFVQVNPNQGDATVPLFLVKFIAVNHDIAPRDDCSGHVLSGLRLFPTGRASPAEIAERDSESRARPGMDRRQRRAVQPANDGGQPQRERAPGCEYLPELDRRDRTE